MTRIAVAGGAGAVGRTFVKALLEANHEVFVFSRTERDSEKPNLAYIKVDYGSIDSLLAVLEKHRIDTVISALSMIDETASQNQLNLIAAADKSGVTRRFIPSEYGGIVNEATARVDPYAQYWLTNAAALAATKGLQHTRVSCGFLMDYWGMPHVDTELAEYRWAVDIARRVAVIPGTGDERLSMTYTRDLAKFVVRLLDEPDWPQKVAVVGQDVTFNQILRWAEKARGGQKFDVRYDPVDLLERGQATPLDDTGRTNELPPEMAAGFGLLAHQELILLPNDKGSRLNERFPELQVTTVEELIKKSWTGK